MQTDFEIILKEKVVLLQEGLSGLREHVTVFAGSRDIDNKLPIGELLKKQAEWHLEKLEEAQKFSKSLITMSETSHPSVRKALLATLLVSQEDSIYATLLEADEDAVGIERLIAAHTA